MNNISRHHSCDEMGEVRDMVVEQEFMRRVLERMDRDGDGKIPASELRSWLTAVGKELSEEEVEEVVGWTNGNGDGLLELEDLVGLVEVSEEEMRVKSMREAFVMYEAEGSGGITAKSLRRMLARLGEKTTTAQCAVMIQAFDLDGDGVINFQEFMAMMVCS